MTTPSAQTDGRMRACILVGTLKRSPSPSSSLLMAQQFANQFAGRGLSTDVIRVVDHEVAPGVELDMGVGDEWPGIRDRIMAADVLGIVSPTWMGHPSSIVQRVLERLDAELSQTDEQGRPYISDRVAVVGVVGNEDGAHKVIADVLQALNDIGLAIPAQASTYWNGEAMKTTDYLDLRERPAATISALETAASNAIDLAERLRDARAKPWPTESGRATEAGAATEAGPGTEGGHPRQEEEPA